MRVETQHPPRYCPYCESLLDMTSGFSGQEPKSGDFTICLYCAQPLRFVDNFHLRKLHPGELESAYAEHADFEKEFSTLIHVIKGLDRRKH